MIAAFYPVASIFPAPADDGAVESRLRSNVLVLRFRLVLVFLCSAPLARAQRPAMVTTTRVVRHLFRPTIDVLGEVEAIRSVDVSTEIGGLVEQLDFTEGKLVKAGDPLLQFRTKMREIGRRVAEARLAAAKQQLAEYRRGSRPEEIVAAERAVAETEARLVEAKDDLARERAKLRSGIGSNKVLSAAVARAASLAATLGQLEARRDLVKKGPRAEVIARAEADVAIRRAELDQIDDELRRAKIVVPFDGVITRKLVERGAYVRPGDPVASVVQLDPVRASVAVPERYIATVERGAELELTLDAFPGKVFQARVQAIIPTGDPLARSFPVRLRLANHDQRILPGMAVRLRLPTAEGRKQLAVPRDALVHSPMLALYKVVDGKAQIVPVRTAASDAGFVQVLGAIAEGDEIVLRGNDGLRPGQPLIVRAAATKR